MKVRKLSALREITKDFLSLAEVAKCALYFNEKPLDFSPITYYTFRKILKINTSYFPKFTNRSLNGEYVNCEAGKSGFRESTLR